MPRARALRIRTASAEDTEAVGRRLGALLGPGDVVALSGALGAGKTVLVRGIAAGARSPGHVASPTFMLIREYPGPVPLFHADLYRLDSPAQLVDLGLEELFDRGGIIVIEWAERAGALLPPEHLWIDLTYGSAPDDRDLRFTAHGPRYEAVLAGLERGWPHVRTAPAEGRQP